MWREPRAGAKRQLHDAANHESQRRFLSGRPIERLPQLHQRSCEVQNSYGGSALGVTHVHHQHAHQWLQSPNSDESSYLDSQMISPGASYTLEMVYNGSGNRNKVVGDSIFHCHFYPHFAAGMWAMWRTHDVFESGTFVYPNGTIVNGKDVSG